MTFTFFRRDPETQAEEQPKEQVEAQSEEEAGVPLESLEEEELTYEEEADIEVKELNHMWTSVLLRYDNLGFQ